MQQGMTGAPVRVGIVGASGYTGAELARLLTAHPRAELVAATASGERVGQKLSDLFPSLRASVEIELEAFDADALAARCDVVFIALGHGKALEIAGSLLERGLRVIDLGADFRLRDAGAYARWYELEHSAPHLLQEAIYGLPELHRDAIRGARLVANPGCYPTAAILALAPLVRADALKAHSLVINAASGTSGAGRASFGLGTHFPEHFGDFRAYKVASHRHTPEIEQGLNDAAGAPSDPQKRPLVTFTPHLLPVSRGILSTCYGAPMRPLDQHEAHAIVAEFYRDEPFVRVLEPGESPHLRAVTGSNFCDIGVFVDERTGRVIVIAAEDNLLKGASGQAVQNLNLMCGFDETLSLQCPALFP